MNDAVLVDAGPLVALLDASDSHHDWAEEQFRHLPGPLATCEPAMAEAFYLLRNLRPAQDKILEWIERRVLIFPMPLDKEARAVRKLWARYQNVPMSLADACLVRMSELSPRARICTVDSDFHIYRKNGGKPLDLIIP
jgi:predicted nucleic acid-binding protein